MDTKITPDDPRLTAYVLGELDGSDAAFVEEQVAADATLRAAVNELRDTTSAIADAFATEQTPSLSPEQKAAVVATASAPPTGRRTVVASLAACVAVACAAVAIVVVNQPPATKSDIVAMRTDSSSAENGYSYQARLRMETEAAKNKATWERLRSNEIPVVEEDHGKDFRLESKAKGQAAPDSTVPVDSFTTPGGQGRPSQNGSPPGYGPLSKSSEQLSKQMGDANNASGEGQKGAASQKPHPTGSPSYGGRDIAGVAPANPTTSPAADPQPIAGKPAGVADQRTKLGGARGGKLQQGQSLARSAKRFEYTERGKRVAGGLVSESRRNLAEFSRAKSRADVDFDFGAQDGAEGFGGIAGGGGRQFGEAYAPIVENEFIVPKGQAALSTFSIDVDTASYSNMRRFIHHGQLPPPNAVRIEELVNYFHYDYPDPVDGRPFSVHTEIAPCPWNQKSRLVRVGLKGREIAHDQRPISNLVFLIDTSGSMRDANKLPLVKQGLQLLTQQMTEDDRIAIVTYSGQAKLALPSTSGEHQGDILTVVHGLNAGGSTNGEAGIQLAYEQAIQNFVENGTNRVILCTDGDFNVGVSGDNELVKIIQDRAKQSKVFLSVFGFGTGNLKDSKMEKLADKGNGHYAYVDGDTEAHKVFVKELTGTLYTIAKDVKIQVEFNPATVGAYRLIGYENRVMAARDFNDDTKDAGEIGAGHNVTALYEVVPFGETGVPEERVDNLKYQQKPAVAQTEAASDELLTVKLRYKLPKEDVSTKIEFPVKDLAESNAQPSLDFDWQASVAMFGMVLRNSKYKGQATIELARELALGARGPDKDGYRREFIDLIYRTERIVERQQGNPGKVFPQLSEKEAQTKAAMNGRFTKLLKKIKVPNDLNVYADFHDYGHWEGTTYAGFDELPAGHWVYVSPHWYIWDDTAGEKQKPE